MRILPVMLTLALPPLQAQMPEVRTTAKDRTALSLTIYQNGLAAIRDTRRLALPAGLSRLAFADLVPTLRPKSATLLASGSDLQIRERNFEFNLLTPASLVDASLGMAVRIKSDEGRPEKAGTLASVPLLNPRMRSDAKPLERIAKLASAYVQAPDPRVVVASADGFHPIRPAELAFAAVPSVLRASPTLLQDVSLTDSAPRDWTLLYTATDFTWTANYVVTVSPDGTHLDLDVFATVKNGGGVTLADTSLQLLAGQPNLVYDPPPRNPNPEPSVDKTTVEVAASLAGPPTFREEKLSEFPVFTLDRPITLHHASEKQLRLMETSEVPIRRAYLVESPYTDYGSSPSTFIDSALFQSEPEGVGYSPIPLAWRTAAPEDQLPFDLPPMVEAMFAHNQWLATQRPPVKLLARFQNVKTSHLGRALPKGPLVLRYQTPTGQLVLIPGTHPGEDEFPQTPPGEDIELSLGPVRGFRVERKGTFRKSREVAAHIDEEGKRHLQRQWDYGVIIKLANDTSTLVEITLREPINGDWTILNATHKGHRSGTDAYDFRVPVPAHGTAVMHYSARTSPEIYIP